MKIILPFAFILVLGASLFTSCKKSNAGIADNESYYCNCGYNSTVTGGDSVISALGVTYGYNFSADAAAIQCSNHQDTLSAKHPGITCGIGF